MRDQLLIHGVRIRVDWEGEPVGLALDDLARHYDVERTDDAEGHPAALTLSLHLTPAPVEWPPDREEPFLLEIGLRARRSGAVLFVGDDHGLIRVDGTDGSAAGVVSTHGLDDPLAPRRYAFSLLLVGIIALLPRAGLYPLHAAALAYGGSGLLLAASSDAGKSTLAYGLVRAGWTYVSDDHVLLRVSSGAVEAMRFRRTFGLDHEAGDLFPELGREWEPHFGDREKWSVTVERLYPELTARCCRPEVLVFPEIVGRAESRIRPVDGLEAMSLLLRQCSVLPLAPIEAKAQMEVLGRLVRQSRPFRLFAGGDLKDRPERFAQMAGQLRAEREEDDSRHPG